MKENLSKRNILVTFGTRPEAIKMAPVILELKKSQKLNVIVCSTGQHREMLEQVLSFFDISVDYDLNVMRPDQTLPDVFSQIFKKLTVIFQENEIDMALIHGDTLTTVSASLSAFYNKVPIAHIEAGLRSGDLHSPWPEEANRKVAGALTSIHFAPTELAKTNLLNEGYNPDCIFVTGNTVIDALKFTQRMLRKDTILVQKIESKFKYLPDDKLILVTGHRRESFGKGFENICSALLKLATRHPDWTIVYPVHLNPNVRKTVYKYLSNEPNILLIDPVEYQSFVYLMQKVQIIITDSGGIQEEAPYFQKPVLVMRDTTERIEALNANTIKLVGTSEKGIIDGVTLEISQYINRGREGRRITNPYGDGNAAVRIADCIHKYFG